MKKPKSKKNKTGMRKIKKSMSDKKRGKHEFEGQNKRPMNA